MIAAAIRKLVWIGRDSDRNTHHTEQCELSCIIRPRLCTYHSSDIIPFPRLNLIIEQYIVELKTKLDLDDLQRCFKDLMDPWPQNLAGVRHSIPGLYGQDRHSSSGRAVLFSTQSTPAANRNTPLVCTYT